MLTGSAPFTCRAWLAGVTDTTCSGAATAAGLAWFPLAAVRSPACLAWAWVSANQVPPASSTTMTAARTRMRPRNRPTLSKIGSLATWPPH